jgi:hypothetical protein
MKLKWRSSQLCTPQYGGGGRCAVWKYHRFDLSLLEKDAGRAVSGWSWDEGCFGHSLPLTTDRLTSFGQRHYNNYLAPNVPERIHCCPYFRAIFEAFECDKSSYRLLWRPALTGYTWHADLDIGEETFRMQIPIETNPDAYLVVSNSERAEDFDFPNERFVGAKNWKEEGITEKTMRDWFSKFIVANSTRIRVYSLEPGHLYHFDTTHFHSVYNFGRTGRLALTVDLVANPWLEQWFPEMAFRRAHRLQPAGHRRLPNFDSARTGKSDEPGTER